MRRAPRVLSAEVLAQDSGSKTGALAGLARSYASTARSAGKQTLALVPEAKAQRSSGAARAALEVTDRPNRSGRLPS